MRIAFLFAVFLSSLVLSACVVERDGYYRTRDEYRSNDSSRSVDRRELADYCRKAAADRYNRNPRSVVTYPAERRDDRYVVRGFYEREGKSDKCFECRFNARGKLTDLKEKDCR